MACCMTDICWCHMTFCPDTCPKFSSKFNLKDVGQIIKCQPCKTNLLHCDLNLAEVQISGPLTWMLKTVSAEQWCFLSCSIKNSLFDQGFKYCMNFTAQKNQHWVNRDDGTVSFSTVCSGYFISLICTATGDVPGLAVSWWEQASVAWQESIALLLWVSAQWLWAHF